MEGAQVHWQVGQGDKERRGGEEELGLGQRDPEGERGGRFDKERGETGREPKASWVTTDSLLGEAVTKGEVLPEGEEQMGETGMVMDSDWLCPIQEGVRLRLVGVVTFGVAIERQVELEVAPSKVREFGAACEASGIVVFREGEDGAEVSEEELGGGEFAADEGGTGEVMRGIGEVGWGENGKAGD